MSHSVKSVCGAPWSGRRPWASVRLLLLLLLGALAGPPAQATIRDESSNAGSELVLVVYDKELNMTYTKDLGLGMDDFFVQGQQDAGVQQFFVVDRAADPSWDKFLLQSPASLANANWAVFAIDNTGNQATVGARRIFTTMAQDKQTNLPSTSNPTVSNITGKFTANIWYGFTNNLGNHYDPALSTDTKADVEIAINGSGLFDGSPGQPAGADFGVVLSEFTRAASPLSPLNKIGDSSWFYYLTRGSSNLASSRALIDEFDNLGADGYWGFIKESVPGSERYLLSYTLPAFTSALEQTAGITLGNNFARMAGILSLSSAAGKGDAVLSLAEGFLRGMARGANTSASQAQVQAVLPGALAPVPEPQTWALLLGGLALVGALARRRAA